MDGCAKFSDGSAQISRYPIDSFDFAMNDLRERMVLFAAFEMLDKVKSIDYGIRFVRSHEILRVHSNIIKIWVNGSKNVYLYILNNAYNSRISPYVGWIEGNGGARSQQQQSQPQPQSKQPHPHIRLLNQSLIDLDLWKFH